MNGACSTPAPDEAAGATPETDTEALATMVRELADHLSHVADLVRSAADVEPERAAEHLLALYGELAPHVRSLASRTLPAAALALFLVR